MLRRAGHKGALLAAVVLLGAAGPPGAESCAGCHVKGGGVGLLLGRPAPDTVREMESFRTGQRPATLMNRIVKGFTPNEVVDLAQWFAKQ